MRLWAALPALAIALFAATSHAQDQDEQLRYPPSSVRPKLIFGGIAVAGLAYAAGYIPTTQWPEVPGATELRYPVVGPWMSLAKIGCSASGYTTYSSFDTRVNQPNTKATSPLFAVTAADCSDVLLFFRGFLTVLDGLAQLGGLGMIGEGLFMTTESDAPKKGPSLGLTIRPAPVITPTMTALGFTGTF